MATSLVLFPAVRTLMSSNCSVCPSSKT